MGGVWSAVDQLDPLAAMGISLEEALAADKKITDKTRKGVRDRRICICGHPVARHAEYAGVLTCKPTAMRCPCKKVRSVLEADDIRTFLRKTEGSGALHALTRGIAASVSSGKKVEWSIPLKCDRCGESEGRKVMPSVVTQGGRMTNHPTGFDVMLCDVCRIEG